MRTYILKFIDELEHKYYKMFMEYNEVDRNILAKKYEQTKIKKPPIGGFLFLRKSD